MRLRGPLADSYSAAVSLVIFSLVPYLALTSAINPLTMVLVKQVPLTQQQLQLTSGMSNAGYAFGTVLAVQLSVHLKARRLLVLYELLFVVASVLVALAPTPGFFIAGHIVQGLTTALMLVAAVPPLITSWPSSKLPIAAGVMNLCIFGAVALGPVVGGVQAGTTHWHALFWIVAGMGGIGLLLSLLTFEDEDPHDRSAPWDWYAQVLAGGGAAAAFFGASELETHRFVDLITFLPLVGGFAMLVALIFHQYRMSNPLMPLKQLANTLPVAGIIIAMTGGAASVALVSLAGMAMEMKGSSPSHTAMLFWPEFGGAVATAIFFAAILRTRFVILLPIAGMAAIAGAAAILTGLANGPNYILVVGSGILGIGVGASVAPALFMTAFTVSATQVQRVIALIELLRAFAAFIASPVLLHVAMTVSPNASSGIAVGMWASLGIAVTGGLVAVYIFALGRVRPRRPDLEDWLNDDGPALQSPRLADGIRVRGASERAGLTVR